MKKIPPFKLNLEPLNEEAASLPKFKWAPNYIGTRHKIGGEPDFIQNQDWPICPDCKKRMTFYAQLDSINDDFCIADCGMIYVFVCLECNTVETRVQSN
jgi:hypothetical protein